ncbi:VWA domain-containing protein [uncultured Polaribacter sp.]|uniref:VWA domain-containing protein n=1 Tax=uncultured Polaribacter sp. TaxID=174711 RepID=UPI00260777EA|nr:VWA domain-containing protein [uncultured Polaribacter sp.]
MQTTTILYIIIALLISVFVAYFQYFYKRKSKPRIHILLFVLKTFSLFLLLLLFINPTIKSKQLENIKPSLSFLIDNSKSIPFFKEDVNIINFKNSLSNNSKLQDKFNIDFFSFSDNLNVLDSLTFNKNATNIANGILKLNELNKNKNNAIVLLTDGNQTIGRDYEFIKSKSKLYPVVFGDTTKYKDVSVTQINVNKYSYIKNKFPVEVILNYEGDQPITTKFSIFSGGRSVYSEKVQFSKNENSKIVLANLTSTKEGLSYYTASIQKIKDEKNIRNNIKNFSVEVIDEQSKILILTSILHPDIGALKKAIESNKQRAVDVFEISKFKKEISDYQLVILYQPNNNFNSVVDDIMKQNFNYFLISGGITDWNFINKKQLGFTKNSINQTENYSAIYNDTFLTFLQKDFGFNQFSPLKDKFGEVNFTKDHQDLLFQNINGLQTEQPLLSVLEQNEQKAAVLFGEDIWKWRAASFLNSNNFEEFDQFVGNLVQYIASKKKRSRLEINAENMYPANSPIKINAFYTDKNYNFDDRASLEIAITNKETKTIKKLPFSLVNNNYQALVNNLPSGNYSYKVTVLGQNIKKYGSFKITDYIIEEQFTSANDAKLEVLAEKTGGKLFYKDQSDKLINTLLVDKNYFIAQKSTITEQSLVNFKSLLFIVLALLAIEWFLRKYYGKI